MSLRSSAGTMEMKMKLKLKNLLLYLEAGIFALPETRTNAQAKKPPPAVQQAAQLPDDEVNPPEVSEADKKAVTVEVRDSYYVEPRSYGTKRIDGTRPEYVVRLNQTGIGVFKDIDWLLAGLDYRYRQEYRYNDLRRPNATTVTGPTAVPPDVDTPALLRARFFLKVEKILDPFHFTLEIEDTRRYPY
jgi:hypothetical protein